jgi:hypothetical protein
MAAAVRIDFHRASPIREAQSIPRALGELKAESFDF